MISLQTIGDVVKFTFNDNPLYLNDGTIEVPKNSLSLLIDESNIATFKKSNGDAFLSCSLDELGMSKEQLITFYKDNMVDEGMSEEEVEDIVDDAIAPLSNALSAHTANTSIHTTSAEKATWNAKLDASDVENFFDGVQYDSNAKRINFYNDNTIKGYVDATAFIKDGMVESVQIVGNNLVITFNTDSGKEAITIPLTDIFNPNNYYTKSEVDTALSGKVDTTVFDNKEQVIATALNDLAENKLDASAYTPTDLSNYYTKSETSGATEIATALSVKADATDLGGLSLVKLTQAQYDALVTKDNDVLYVIVD